LLQKTATDDRSKVVVSADRQIRNKVRLINFDQYIERILCEYNIVEIDLRCSVYRKVLYFLIDNFNSQLIYDESNQENMIDEGFVFNGLENLLESEIRKS